MSGDEPLRVGVVGMGVGQLHLLSWLGVEGAEAKLKALKGDATEQQRPIQATEAAAPEPVAEAEPAAETSAEVPVAAPAPANGSGSAGVADTRPPFPAGKDEWVALLSYANVRAAPSSNADTLRVAEKGTKFRATGRQGNWVQVTDPATSEVGWVYARYVEAASAR